METGGINHSVRNGHLYLKRFQEEYSRNGISRACTDLIEIKKNVHIKKKIKRVFTHDPIEDVGEKNETKNTHLTNRSKAVGER